MPRLPTALLAAVAAIAAACGGPAQTDSAAPHTSTTPIAACRTADSASPPTAPKPPAVIGDPPANLLRSGVSNGHSYLVLADTTDAKTADGHGHWHIRAGQLTGQDGKGDPAVIKAFNTASTACANRLLDEAHADAAAASDWDIEVRPTVTFRPTAISELLVGVYYAHQAAHPVNYIHTIVIDSRTAQPISLNTLFNNESRGLQRLSEQTRLLWAQASPPAGAPAPDEPGLAPREENFANWIPTAAGIEIHFRDYQFGHGLPVVTIPWTALNDVLSPTMTALTNP
jgi:hypothetical protein